VANLKQRISALERAHIPKDWLVMECETAPTQSQLDEMEAATKAGQVAVLFGQRHDWLWMPGADKPWLENEQV